MSTPSQKTSGYQVTGQNPGMVPDATGTYVPGVTVTFRTGTGHVGTVDLTRAQYDQLDTARGIIRAAAAQSDAIGQLSEPPSES